ncbi:MAG: putative alpha/beta-fold hydrolase [Cryomorphaceae bacterium]|jgi:predicted alpha/beta-fold hydrolase
MPKPQIASQPVSKPHFEPPLGMRNRHVQTIFSSVGPRRFKVTKQFAQHKSNEQALILECGDGVRLSGVLNQCSTARADKLAILIHGWEGSQDSSYMLSMANSLLREGVDVFRLNLRDHGDSHHLNEGMFNSTLIDEVIGGIANLQSRYDYPDYYLAGFSLGGNFSLRVAAMAHDRSVRLSSVIAFCPVVHAGKSNTVLNASHNWLYGTYFVRKWKKSLRKKMRHFPQYNFAQKLDSMKTLDQMNQQFVPNYTRFTDLNSYFEAYAIDGDTMQNTICPCYLHFARDDMIIPVEGANTLAANPDLKVTITDHGGHCGFIKNWRFESWQDQRAVEIITGRII